MYLLPYIRFTLHSPDPVPIVQARLTSYVDDPKPWRRHLYEHHAPYQGTVAEDGFLIYRAIHYRNSFLPLIRGKFHPMSGGTTIAITMRLHPFTLLFVGFWYLVWFGFTLPAWLSGAMPTSEAMKFLGLPLLLLGIFWASFWYEAKRGRKDLEAILAGHNPALAASLAPGRGSSKTILPIIEAGFIILSMVVVFWQALNQDLAPFPRTERITPQAAICSPQSTPSPYCHLTRVRTLTGHTSVQAIALSTDGQTLASGGDDKAIRIWDVTTGEMKKVLQSDSGKIYGLAIAPDGNTVVSVSGDRMMRIWNLKADQPPILVKSDGRGFDLVSITPDGKTILTGSHGAVQFWDLTTGQLKNTLPTIPEEKIELGPVTIRGNDPMNFRTLDLNPIHKTALLDFASGGLSLWDLSTDRETQRFVSLNPFSGYLMAASMNADGTKAALQYSNPFKKFETRLVTRDLTTGDITGKGSMAFSSATFLPVQVAVSQDHIFGITEGRLQVWDLHSATLEASLKTDWMAPLVVSPDGKLLAGVAGDPFFENTTIQIFKRP